MAVLRLELDIDGDVYPELHARLALLSSAAARGERMRQLAATGLVWETVRLQGGAVPATLPAARPKPAPAAAPRPAARRAAPPLAGFVDLAIDAVPAPPPPAFDHALQTAAQHLPVLVDVVHPAAAPAAGQRSRALQTPDAEPAERLDTVTDRVDDDSAPLDIVAQRPAPRSRLLRMKERGLFKNDG